MLESGLRLRDEQFDPILKCFSYFRSENGKNNAKLKKDSPNFHPPFAKMVDNYFCVKFR